METTPVPEKSSFLERTVLKALCKARNKLPPLNLQQNNESKLPTKVKADQEDLR